MGYSVYKQKLSDAGQQNFTIYLKSSSDTLGDVIVRPHEDPAVVLMKKVQMHRPENNQQQVPAYKQEVYNKIEIDITNIPFVEGITKRIRPFDFIDKYIDSTSDEKPFLPFFLTESLSDYYYRKQPKPKRKILWPLRSQA